jgi:putative membrane protein
MVQHTLLIVVAAPLLALGAPVILSRMPEGWQRRAAAVRGPGLIAWLGVAVALQGAAMVLWHLPPAFQAAVQSDPLHGVEHITMLATAVFFWWVVFAAKSNGVIAAIVALFLTTGVCSALGAGLTLSSHTWYPAYRSMSDQAMGGVIMWAVVGTAYLVGAVVLFFGWLSELERTSPGELMGSA